MSCVLSVLFSFITRVNKERDAGRLSRDDAGKAYGLMLDIDRVLGLGLEKIPTKLAVPEELRLLVKEREEFRKKKDYKGADRIREKIKKKGFILEDTPDGPRVRKAL